MRRQLAIAPMLSVVLIASPAYTSRRAIFGRSFLATMNSVSGSIISHWRPRRRLECWRSTIRQSVSDYTPNAIPNPGQP